MNDFDKKIQESFSYKSYKAHFKPLYRVAQFVKALLLLASCIFSSVFFAQAFTVLGEYAIYAGFAVSAFIAFFIGMITDKVLLYYSAQESIDVLMFSILVALMTINVYGDFKGADELGVELAGTAPTDEKTGEISGIYTPQIQGINDEVNDLEAKNFYWCAEHKQAHKCEFANFYVDKKQDRAVIAKIAILKARKDVLLGTMNTMLSNNDAQFKDAYSTHSVKVTQSRNRMRFSSLACTVLFIAFSLWAHNYGLRAVSHTPATVPNKSVSTRKAKKKNARRDNSNAMRGSVYEDRDELTDEELSEELHAMREKERNAGK